MGHLQTGDGLDSARGLRFADGCFRNIPRGGGEGRNGDLKQKLLG